MTVDDYYGSESPGEAFAKYWRDGFALFPKLFSDAEVDELLIRAMLARGDERKQQECQGSRGTAVFRGAAVDPVLDAARSLPRLIEIASELLGTADIRQYCRDIRCRDPGTGETTDWRRDESLLAQVRNPRGNSTALALYLDDVLDVEQGAVLFVPGSHEWAPDRPADSAGGERCEAMLPRRGMIGIWNAGTIHSARPNRSRRERRSLVHGYVRADATTDPAHVGTWQGGESLNRAGQDSATMTPVSSSPPATAD